MSLTRLQPNSVNKTAAFTFGNVTANFLFGNGYYLSGISGGGASSYGNSNVADYLPTYTGNIAGNYFIGNGSTLTFITGSNVTGYVSNATNANSATTAGTVTTNAQPNITSVGTLTDLTVTGNISANYFIGDGSQLTGLPASYSNTNVANYLPTYTGNLVALTGAVTTTSNVTANYFIGNGSTLTNITGANVTGYVANATNANTVTTAAQPNITSVGSLTALTVTGLITATGTGIKTSNVQDSSGTITITTRYGNVSGDVGVYGNITAGTNGTGNVTATYFIGNGSQLTDITATTATTAGTVTTNAQPNITSVGTLTSLTTTANGNITMSGSLSRLTGANLVNATYLTGTLTTAAQPNITSTGTLTSLIVSGNTTISGNLTLQQSIEVLTTKTGATGVVTHDLSTGAIFYHTSPSANFTANFTNVPTTDNRAIVVTLVMVQGATAYLPTAVQIDGVAQTIKWDGGSPPTGTSSGINPVTFALFRVSSAWTVTGVMGSYS